MTIPQILQLVGTFLVFLLCVIFGNKMSKDTGEDGWKIFGWVVGVALFAILAANIP